LAQLLLAEFFGMRCASFIVFEKTRLPPEREDPKTFDTNDLTPCVIPKSLVSNDLALFELVLSTSRIHGLIWPWKREQCSLLFDNSIDSTPSAAWCGSLADSRLARGSDCYL